MWGENLRQAIIILGEQQLRALQRITNLLNQRLTLTFTQVMVRAVCDGIGG